MTRFFQKASTALWGLGFINVLWNIIIPDVDVAYAVNGNVTKGLGRLL
jgi:hypothetical protein